MPTTAHVLSFANLISRFGAHHLSRAFSFVTRACPSIVTAQSAQRTQAPSVGVHLEMMICVLGVARIAKMHVHVPQIVATTPSCSAVLCNATEIHPSEWHKLET